MTQHLTQHLEIDPASVETVLACYEGFPASRVIPLGAAGGLSGARFWRLETAGGPFCLRAWPKEHPDFERLEFIHTLLAHVWGQDFHKVPVPLRDREGRSAIRLHGRFWELTPWLPGKADYREHPSRARLASAMEALAQFHLAAEGFRSPREKGRAEFGAAHGKAAGSELAAAPGVLERKQLLAGFLGEESVRLAAAMKPEVWPDLIHRGRSIVDLFSRAAPRIFSELQQAASETVPLQPCLRDVHHAHVLFTGDEVSGIVDFGAARYECVAADLARLLGSLVGDEPDAWQNALEHYYRVRPLLSGERKLVAVYDRSTVVLGPMLWLRGGYLEGRQFDQPQRVLRRIEEGLVRLERLAALC